MRYTLTTLGVALAIVVFSTVALAEKEKVDWYDEVGVYLVHDVDHHFYLARVDFAEKSLEAAAKEIRTAAILVRFEADRAVGDPEKALMASVRELQDLADSVEKGDVASPKKFDEAFAHAHHALAWNHYMEASRFWEKKDAKHTGQALKAAIIHLERAVVWAGYKGETLVAEVSKVVAPLAEKLIAGGGGWLEEEVGKALEALGKAIEDIGKSIEPAKK